jgi:hypothetical protein
LIWNFNFWSLSHRLFGRGKRGQRVGENMAERLDLKETVSFEELLMSKVNTQKAVINLLERKGS